MDGLHTQRSVIAHWPRSSRGFTLLEVLLAFVVFALSFAVVLEIQAGSLRSAVRAREYSEAALLAQSVMEMVGTEIPLLEGSLQGEEQQFGWVLNINAFQPSAGQERFLELATMNGTLLYWVDLEVSWSSGRRVRTERFSTVRGILDGAVQ